MIQRIQSIYFLLAAIFMLLIFSLPIAIFSVNNQVYQLFACHVGYPQEAIHNFNVLPLTITSFVSVVVSIITIFLFKNRKIQIKLGQLNLFLVVTVIALEVFYFLSIQDQLGVEGKPMYAAIFPIIAFAFLFLSIRGVKRDEALVRSADRIR